MIQAVSIGGDRDDLNKHYTSVSNILKLIKPLFLDEFYEELEKSTTINQLYKLQNRIAKAKFFESRQAYKTYFKENPEAKVKNMVFGEMNKYASYLLERKHLNHHFEQFDVL